jgi:hypothetical protein
MRFFVFSSWEELKEEREKKGRNKMREKILLVINGILIFLFGLTAISMGSEIKTIEDFRNSSFIKKYKPQRTKSWDLRDGRYNYSFSFYFSDFWKRSPTDNHIYGESDWFSAEVQTKSKNDSKICSLGIMFVDEPEVPPQSEWYVKFTKHIKDISQDLISSIDSSLPLKDIMGYVESHSTFKLGREESISDAPKKTFGRYFFQVGLSGPHLIIHIQKEMR